METIFSENDRRKLILPDLPLYKWHEQLMSERAKYSVTLVSANKGKTMIVVDFGHKKAMTGGLFSKTNKNFTIKSQVYKSKEIVKNLNDFAALEEKLAERFPFIVLPPLKEPFLTFTLNELAGNPFIRSDFVFEEFLNPGTQNQIRDENESEGLLRWKQAISLRSEDNHRASTSFISNLRNEFDELLSHMKKLVKPFQAYSDKLAALAAASTDVVEALNRHLDIEKSSTDHIVTSIPHDCMLEILGSSTNAMMNQKHTLQNICSVSKFSERVLLPLEYDIHILSAWRNHIDSVKKKFRAYAKLGEKLSKEKDPQKVEKLKSERLELELYLYQYEEGTLGIELERFRNGRYQRFLEWKENLFSFSIDLSENLTKAWKLDGAMQTEEVSEPKTEEKPRRIGPPPPVKQPSQPNDKEEMKQGDSLAYSTYSTLGGNTTFVENEATRTTREELQNPESSIPVAEYENILGSPGKSKKKKKRKDLGPPPPPPMQSSSKLREHGNSEFQDSQIETSTRPQRKPKTTQRTRKDASQIPRGTPKTPRPSPRLDPKPSFLELSQESKKEESKPKPVPRKAPTRKVELGKSPPGTPVVQKPANFLAAIEGFNKSNLNQIQSTDGNTQSSSVKAGDTGSKTSQRKPTSPLDELRERLKQREVTHENGMRK